MSPKVAGDAGKKDAAKAPKFPKGPWIEAMLVNGVLDRVRYLKGSMIEGTLARLKAAKASGGAFRVYEAMDDATLAGAKANRRLFLK